MSVKAPPHLSAAFRFNSWWGFVVGFFFFFFFFWAQMRGCLLGLSSPKVRDLLSRGPPPFPLPASRGSSVSFFLLSSPSFPPLIRLVFAFAHFHIVSRGIPWFLLGLEASSYFEALLGGLPGFPTPFAGPPALPTYVLPANSRLQCFDRSSHFSWLSPPYKARGKCPSLTGESLQLPFIFNADLRDFSSRGNPGSPSCFKFLPHFYLLLAGKVALLTIIFSCSVPLFSVYDPAFWCLVGVPAPIRLSVPQVLNTF